MASNFVCEDGIERCCESKLKHLSGFTPGNEVKPECQVISAFQPEARQLETLFDDCEKNPKHAKFIPVHEFRKEDLPLPMRNKNTMDELYRLCVKTVRIRAVYTSEKRPDTFSDSKSQYPYIIFKGKTSKNIRYGTGIIREIFHQPVENTPCPCHECKKSEQPKMKHWKVVVGTATHVIFDDSEAERAEMDCFFDSDSDDPSKDNKLYGLCIEGGGTTFDVMYRYDISKIICVTHNVDLADKLWNRLSLEETNQCIDHEPSPFFAVVSHPHGYGKRISIGQIVYCTIPIQPVYSTDKALPLWEDTVCRLALLNNNNNNNKSENDETDDTSPPNKTVGSKTKKIHVLRTTQVKEDQQINISDISLDEQEEVNTVDSTALTVLNAIQSNIENENVSTVNSIDMNVPDVFQSTVDYEGESTNNSTATTALDMINPNIENETGNTVATHDLFDKGKELLGYLLDKKFEIFPSKDFPHASGNFTDTLKTITKNVEELTEGVPLKPEFGCAVEKIDYLYTSETLEENKTTLNEENVKMRPSEVIKTMGYKDMTPSSFQGMTFRQWLSSEIENGLTDMPDEEDGNGWKNEMGRNVNDCGVQVVKIKPKSPFLEFCMSLILKLFPKELKESIPQVGFVLNYIMSLVDDAIPPDNRELPFCSNIDEHRGQICKFPSGVTFKLPPEAEYAIRYHGGYPEWFQFPPGTKFSLSDGTDLPIPDDAYFKNHSLMPEHCFVTYDIPTCPGSSGAGVIIDKSKWFTNTLFHHSGSYGDLNRSCVQDNPGSQDMIDKVNRMVKPMVSSIYPYLKLDQQAFNSLLSTYNVIQNEICVNSRSLSIPELD